MVKPKETNGSVARRLVGAAFVVSSFCGGLACGSDNADKSDSAPTLQEVPALWATARCEAIWRCGSPHYIAEISSVQNCAADRATGLSDWWLPPVAAAVAAGTVVYHADRVLAAADRLRSAPCQANELNSQPMDFLEGTLPVGEPCNVTEECAPGGYCEFDGPDGLASCPGTCTARGAEGDPCECSNASGECCGAGLSCRSIQGEWRCVVDPGEGSPCLPPGPNYYDCGGLLACSGQSDTSAGTCVTWESLKTGDKGDVCDFDTVICKDGLVCTASLAGTTGEIKWNCQPKVQSGAPCSLARPSQCPEGEYCLGTSETAKELKGKCGPPPTAGQSCDYFDSPCAAWLTCDSDDTCQARKPLGSECASDFDCRSYRCEANVCVGRSCGL